MPCIGQLLVSRICAQISTKPRRADPLIRKSFVVYGVTWQFITVQGTKLRAVLTSVSFQCEKSCRDTVHTSHFRPYLKAMGSQSDQNRRRESQQFQTARRQEDQTHPRLARRQQPGFRCSCHREHPTNDHSRVKQPEYTFSKQHRIPTEIEPEFRRLSQNGRKDQKNTENTVQQQVETGSEIEIGHAAPQRTTGTTTSWMPWPIHRSSKSTPCAQQNLPHRKRSRKYSAKLTGPHITPLLELLLA